MPAQSHTILLASRVGRRPAKVIVSRSLPPPERKGGKKNHATKMATVSSELPWTEVVMELPALEMEEDAEDQARRSSHRERATS